MGGLREQEGLLQGWLQHESWRLTVARDHHRGPKSAWVCCELWRTLLSTSKPPEKDILWLQDPLGRGPGVKQSVVGGLGVNRQREDESGVESSMQPATS